LVKNETDALRKEEIRFLKRTEILREEGEDAGKGMSSQAISAQVFQ
jgi:hypothetical protein